MSFHKDLTGTDIHVPYSWTYANSTLREAATGFVSGDLGKFARQSSDNSIWMLTATTPTWVQISASASTSPWTKSTIAVTGSETKTLDTISLTGFRGAKYIICVYDATNKVKNLEMLIVYQNSLLSDIIYGRIGSGISFSLNATIDSGDMKLVLVNNESYSLSVELNQLLLGI